jgi:adenylate cyclase
VGIFSLYTETTPAEFWRVAAVAEGVVLVAVTYAVLRESRLARPIIEWIRAGRPEEDALGVWRCAVAMPRQLVLANGWRAFAIVALPVAVYATVEFELTVYEGAIVFAGALVAVGYAAIRHLPPDFGGARLGVPLRWKLLGALPLINVITGVVASGLSTDGSASLNDLGLDVVVAVGVAFTISFELVVLVTRSMLRPVDDLLEATDAVKRGDPSARVPVVSGDELGALAGSFNEMMEGLSERERLRTAFGSYVDPEVAERMLEEGELLEGQEREVTVMFVDVCDFTARAEASTARETVAFLNGRQQIPRRRRAGGVRGARAATGSRRPGRERGARDCKRRCRTLRTRGGDWDRNQHRPGRGRIGRRRRPAGVLRDRRRGQCRGPRTGSYARNQGRCAAHGGHS